MVGNSVYRGAGVRRWAAAALLIPLLLGGAGAPGPQRQDGQAGVKDVYDALGIDSVAADYVILVDVSSSMRGDRYRLVKSTLERFYAALAPNDKVTVVTFDSTAHRHPTLDAGRSDELLSQLPDDAAGRGTDIGQAIEAGIEVLERSGAPEIATLVLLTDGRHEPGSNTAYRFDEGAAWNQLRERAAALKKKSKTAFAMPLEANTGAGLLQKVFTGAQLLQMGNLDDLAGLLELPKQQVLADKARSLVAGDAQARVEVVVPGGGIRLRPGDNRVTLHLRSTAKRVPLRVTGLTVKLGGPVVATAVSGTPVELKPGQTADVDLVLNWPAGPKSLKWNDPVRVTDRAEFAAVVGSPWSDVLRKHLGLDFQPSCGCASVEVVGDGELGSPGLWLGGAAGLLVLIVFVVVLLWMRAHPTVPGNLRVSKHDTEVGVIKLGRRATALPGSLSFIGSGRVRGRRRRGDVLAEISYSPDGSSERLKVHRCEAGESVILNGVRFTWLPPGRAHVRRPAPPEPEPRAAVAEPIAAGVPRVTAPMVPTPVDGDDDSADFIDSFDFSPGRGSPDHTS